MPLFAGLHDDFVAAIEEDEGAVVGFGRGRGVQPADAFGGDGERAGGVAEFAGAGEHVGEGVARWCRRAERLRLPGRDGDVEVDRVGGDAVDGTLFSPERAADDAGLGAVVVGDVRGFRGL